MQSRGKQMRFSIRKLMFMAILLAIALIIFVIEAQIPLPIPIPGVKLGLSNAVTLFALFFSYTGTRSETGDGSLSLRVSERQRTVPCLTISLNNLDVFLILICRIILGLFFTGRLITFAFSLCGGLASLLAMIIMKKFVNTNQIWVCGAIGAVFHNIAQIGVAIFLTGSPAVAAYLPILIITGIITGVFTGLVAQLTLLRLGRER